VQALDAPGYSWKKYALTVAGVARAREILAVAPGEVAHRAVETKNLITGKSLSGPLGDVYSRYPAFATNSLFRS